MGILLLPNHLAVYLLPFPNTVSFRLPQFRSCTEQVALWEPCLHMKRHIHGLKTVPISQYYVKKDKNRAMKVFCAGRGGRVLEPLQKNLPHVSVVSKFLVPLALHSITCVPALNPSPLKLSMCHTHTDYRPPFFSEFDWNFVKHQWHLPAQQSACH